MAGDGIERGAICGVERASGLASKQYAD